MAVMIGMITKSIFSVAFLPNLLYSSSDSAARMVGLLSWPEESLFFSWSTSSCCEMTLSLLVMDEMLAFLVPEEALIPRGADDMLTSNKRAERLVGQRRWVRKKTLPGRAGRRPFLCLSLPSPSYHSSLDIAM